MDNLLSENSDYRFNIALLQTWRERKFSYINSARMDNGFLYLFDGHITYTFDNKKIELSKGDIIYLPKGSYYEAEFDVSLGEVKNYLINFDVLGEDKLGGIDTPTLFYRDTNSVLLGYFKDVREAYRKKDLFLTRSLFYTLLRALKLTQSPQIQNENEAYLKKGADLLQSELDMSVEKVALALHLSRSTFQKKFKECYGMSPVKYRQQKRLETAKLWLGTTDKPIKEIAEELDFYDLAYFYKVFESSFNVSPKKYRDDLKKYM